MKPLNRLVLIAVVVITEADLQFTKNKSMIS